MSGLAGLLAGHQPPGIYSWHAAFEAEDVRRTIEHAGARCGYVDGWTHATRAEVLAALGDALAFPDWYGKNLDALADCLADLDSPTVLLWDGWSTLAREDRPAFDGILEVLTERGEAAAVPFSVLLRGGGPALGVPALDA